MVDPIEKLFSFSGRGATTFEAMKRLDQKLQFPHRSFKSIHVGGTNGKGSVSWKIAEGLRAEGYSVGLYTSPHIDSFRERILVNGEQIPEAIARELTQSILDWVDEELSFFDLLTALAFVYFSQKKVDWAVIEVGLGGRLDATNIIHPELAIVTTIGWDHMHLLGNTLEKIAKEKEAIFKEGTFAMVGPQAAPFFPRLETILCQPSPFYDGENNSIAQAALRKLGVQEASILQGIQVRPPCRFEHFKGAILDAAHNVSAFEKLIQALKFHFPKERFHFIVAFSKEKDWKECLKVIEPHAAHISFAGKDNPRFHPLGSLSVKEALAQKREERAVICGSFYIMAEARDALAIQMTVGDLGRLSQRW